MKMNEAIKKYLRKLDESVSDETLTVEGESGSFNINDHEFNRFYIKDCNFKTLSASNTKCYVLLQKSNIDSLDLKNVSGRIESSYYNGSVKVNKGKVSNFGNLQFDSPKITLKDIEFVNGESLELRGSALKLRKIKIKNVRKVDIQFEGNNGKIILEIENCGEVNISSGRDVICTLDKVIITNCNIKEIDFQNRRDKVVVNKLILNKCKIPNYIYRDINKIGSNSKFTHLGIDTVNDALKDNYYNIILIDC